MALLNYQSNVIKQIYGDEMINQPYVTNTEVENYYKYNSSFSKCIESPDLMTIISSYHGFTDYALFTERNDGLTNEEISRIRIPSAIIKTHLAYFKILNDKDIDWENAYLRYSGDYQTCNPEIPFEYNELIAEKNENGKVVLRNIHHTLPNEYLFNRGLCSYINNTYDLMNIIDYLFIRLKVLKMLFNLVKEQHTAMDTYLQYQNKEN